jgi:parallel beta-helix repeat protein
MYTKHIFLTCVHSFLLLAAVFAFFSPCNISYAAAILNVPDPYPTIQEAINAASAGDTINVSRRSGESQSVYYEKLVIDKQLTLLGESRETIIIDGTGTGTVIRIQADSVEIRGFTVRNGSRKYSGIRANDYSYITLANNTVETNKYGITLLYSHYNTIVQNQILNNTAAGVSISESIGNNISNNTVSESAYGLKLSSTNTTFVRNNTVADNSYGIYLQSSSNDTIDRNTVIRNAVDGILQHASHDVIVSNNKVSQCAYGIQLYNSYAITVLENNATDNSYGMYLAYSGPSNTIENNTFHGNDWGVSLYSSSGNTVTGNTLSSNTYGVDPVTESNNNLLHHNNFKENIEQAVWNPDCINVWDDGYPSGGNYWSDYTGTDSNGDGIGDTAYVIDPMNTDRYPLVTPWGINRDIAIIEVTPSSPKAYVGDVVAITVVAENQGTETETFNVTVKYENTTLAISGVVGIQEVANLAPQETATLMFSWNTADAQPCVYHTISAEATIVSGETDTEDNVYSDGTVKINLVGDITGDGAVDIADLSIVSLAFGAFEGEPEYNPEADLIKDGVVDTRDVALVCRNYGNTC